jgi:hypothetical protein
MGAILDLSHNHDDRYYTEAEIDALLDAIGDSGLTLNGPLLLDPSGLPASLPGRESLNYEAVASLVRRYSAASEHLTPWTLNGPLANSLSLDTRDGAYVEIPDSLSLEVGSATTFEAWIYAHDTTFGEAANKERAWEVGLNDGTNDFSVAINTTADETTTNWVWVKSGYNVPVNTWTHIAFAYDGTNIYFYVNGTLVSTQANTVAGAITDTTAPLRFAARDSNFDGVAEWKRRVSLDDVRLWNVVRAQADIQANKDAELVGNEAGLVGYWKLNEGKGTVINDATANANHGTLIAAANGNLFEWGLGTDPADPEWRRLMRLGGSGRLTVYSDGVSDDIHAELWEPKGLGNRPVNLRFHQAGRYWRRISVDNVGFHFKHGDTEAYQNVYTGPLIVNSLGGQEDIHIKGTSPTIEWDDTDLTGAGSRYWIHVNGRRMYFLQDRTGDGNWNSPHPMQIESDGTVTIGIKLGGSGVVPVTALKKAQGSRSGAGAFGVHQYAFASPISTGSGGGSTELGITVIGQRVSNNRNWWLNDSANTITWDYLTASGEPRIWAAVDPNGNIIEMWEGEDPVDREFPDEAPIETPLDSGLTIARLELPDETLVTKLMDFLPNTPLPSWHPASRYREINPTPTLVQEMLATQMKERGLEVPPDIREVYSAIDDYEKRYWRVQLWLRSFSRVSDNHRNNTLIPVYKRMLRVTSNGKLELK